MEVEPTVTKADKKNENVAASASGESAAEYPKMKLAQTIHRAILMSGANPKISPESAVAASINISAELPTKLLEQVKEMENPSLYKHLAPLLQWSALPDADLTAMEDKNKEIIEALEAKVEDAKENAGDMEVLGARFEIAKFAAKSMSKDEALAAYQKVLDLPKLSSGKQMDALMEQSRISSFYGDIVSNNEYIKKVRRSICCRLENEAKRVFRLEN
jgi:26S proteasome regulatory subunit N7